MYTYSDIRTRVDSSVFNLGYKWLKSEMLYGQLPTVYWTNGSICLRIRIVERQNAVDFDITDMVGDLPPAHDEHWVSLYTFSEEYARRIDMSMTELLALIPANLKGCLEQIDSCVLELPTLLNKVMVKKIMDQEFTNHVKNTLDAFLKLNGLRLLSIKERQEMGIGLKQSEYIARGMTSHIWRNEKYCIEIYSDPQCGEINCCLAKIPATPSQPTVWKYLYELFPLTQVEFLEIKSRRRSTNDQIDAIKEKLEVNFCKLDVNL